MSRDRELAALRKEVLVARASLFKAQTYNDPMREYQKAVDTAKKFFDILPSYESQPLGVLMADIVQHYRARIGAITPDERRLVMSRGWQHTPVIGPFLRWLGPRLP